MKLTPYGHLHMERNIFSSFTVKLVTNITRPQVQRSYLLKNKLPSETAQVACSKLSQVHFDREKNDK